MKKKKRFKRTKISDPFGKFEPSSDLFFLYLKDTHAYSPLPHKEIVSRLQKDNDRTFLVLNNLNLVVDIAEKFAGNSGKLSLMDLIQEGNLGLFRAAEKYNWRRGFEFSTYAAWWIRQKIIRAIIDFGNTIRVPVHAVGEIQKYNKAVEELTRKLKQEPTTEEIAANLNWTTEQIRKIQQIIFRCNVLSLNMEDEKGNPIQDAIPDLWKTPDETFEELNSSRVIQDALKEMEERRTGQRHVLVLKLRWGLDGHKPHTLDKIGKSPEWLKINNNHPVTKERIRQIEVKAFNRLRRLLQRKEMEQRK